MRLLPIIAHILLICNILHKTLAFPYLQQQQLQSKGESTSLTTTSYKIVKYSDIPRWNNHDKYCSILNNSLRAGGDGSISKINDASILGRYARFVDEKPLLAKSLTAGIVTGMANLFSQIIPTTQLQSTINNIISWRRVAVYMLTGVGFIGPYLHIWYGYLDRVLAMPKQKSTTRTATKVIVDQIIGVCIFYPLYFMFMEIAESILFVRCTYNERLKCPSWMILIY